MIPIEQSPGVNLQEAILTTDGLNININDDYINAKNHLTKYVHLTAIFITHNNA